MLIKTGGKIGVLDGRDMVTCTKKMDKPGCKYGLVNYVELVSGKAVRGEDVGGFVCPRNAIFVVDD